MSADRQFTATFIANDSLVGDGGSSGYVWGDNPLAASYTPSATYQYDTVSTSATVNKLGTGQWSITFPSAGTGNSGDEQATAYGSTDAYCIVDGPGGLLGGTQVADVFCFDNSGNPVDTTYTMQWWNK